MGVTIPLPELDLPKPTPAPAPDALAEFQRAAQLKTQAAQQQAIAAQTEGQQQQNQMQAMQLKDEQLRRQLAPQFVQKGEDGKVTGFDNEGLYSAMLSNGADPLNIQKMRMSQVEMQKGLIGLGDAQLAHQEKINGELYNSLESIRDINKKTAPATPAAPQAQPQQPAANQGIPPIPMRMPDANTPPAPAQDIGAAAPGSPESFGAKPSGEAATPTETGLQQAAAGPKPISHEAQLAYQKELMRLSGMGIPIGKLKPVLESESDLDQAEAELGLHKQALSDAKEVATTQEAAGKGAQSQAEAEASQWKPAGEGTLVNFKTGQMIHGVAPVEREEMLDWLSKNPSKGPADFMKAKALTVPAFNLNMNATGGGLGPSAGGAGTGANAITDVPAAIRGRVQAIVDYRQALPPAGRNNPVNSAISEWVQKIDPQHDETMFPARNKMMTAMTSGKEANQINAVNTALGHVGVLNDAIDGLQNHDTKLLNSVGNRLGIEFGSKSGDATAMFNTIVHRVGPELAAAYIQGGGGEGERGTTAADFDASLSPSILHNNTAITAKLLRSKIGSLENQYKNTMKRDDFQQRFITPEAQSTLQKLSPQGGGGGQQFSHLSASGKFGWDGTEWVPIPGK